MYPFPNSPGRPDPAGPEGQPRVVAGAGLAGTGAEGWLASRVAGTGVAVLGSRYWVRGTGFAVLGSRYWVRGYWVRGTGFAVLGSRYWVRGTGFAVLGSRVLVPKAGWIRVPCSARCMSEPQPVQRCMIRDRVSFPANSAERLTRLRITAPGTRSHRAAAILSSRAAGARRSLRRRPRTVGGSRRPSCSGG